MSERYDANPNNLTPSADRAHAIRYFLARGFIRPGEVVVDGACGPGYGSVILSEVAKIVLAIDKDEVFHKRWERNNILFGKSSLEEIDFYNKNIDTWVCIETIEHLKDPEKFLDKVTKTAKKKIIISSPNKNTAGDNEFHLTDVKLDDLQRMMKKYPEWKYYGAVLDGYHYIAVYVKQDIKLI